ncbi:MAG: hypothetical protein A3K08_00350 [Candidatus Doudnabacteria bacterium RIFCSPLOWO2_01_41_7]|nr:MAG: hypothetical protein A3K08_00350 [Candidatus Doudnabacteria bacterium RIFCSPLOWO2_01_41_7]
MTISWYGLSSFKIIGKDLTIITDPFGSGSGLSPVRGGADIVISSNPSLEIANNFSSITGTPFIITGPGEYDIKGAFIIGAPGKGGTIYSIEVEGIRIAFLGQIKQTELTDDQKESLEGADIILVPVGGKDVMDFETAAKVATKLEPFVVIPHSYKIPGVSLNLDKLDKFLQEMGGKHQEMDKLTLKKKEVVGEQTQLIILTPQR